jgi:DNA gyrase/topoisomerase IV subunit A
MCKATYAMAGISDVRDESDRDGMRVVVEVKRGSTPKVRQRPSTFACAHATLPVPCTVTSVHCSWPSDKSLKFLAH